jgi:beta-glucanase (GH16 family)
VIGSRRLALVLSVVASVLVMLAVGAPAALAATTTTVSWGTLSPLFRRSTALNHVTVAKTPGTVDGTALKLQLDALPGSGPNLGVGIVSSRSTYRYGVFGSRLKTADCTGQDHAGVVTATFAYSLDHLDANHNGIPDNDEIDIEFLCGQPNVVYLTLWTDYSETSDNLASYTRAIDLQTGKVLMNCYLIAYSKPCQLQLPGENSPAAVPPIPGFNSAKQFFTFMFDWEPDHVTFYDTDNAGHKTVLWDYRGPKSRIPQKPSVFMQNVWWTRGWNPLNGPSHNQPTANTTAYVDATYLPK